MISATTMEFGNNKHVNVVFDNGQKMISLSCDNGVGGGLVRLSRSDIRLLRCDPLEGGVKDVTSLVFGGDEEDKVIATVEAMAKAINWLSQTQWGMEAQ